MKIAFLYAGQGSQTVGMGKDFYSENEEFRNAFDFLPETLRKLCFEGPLDELSQTQNTQPCMVAFAAGVTAVLKQKNIQPCMAAGLSLGEYSALHGAGVFSAREAINLVSFRGQQMAKACEGRPCKMAAILMLDKDILQQCCNNASSLGTVQIANYNCPGQLVIGGDAKAVEQTMELALKAGAKRALPLNVSGAFHTSLMKSAGDALCEKFKEIEFKDMLFPVIFNSTAKPINADETIAGLLEKQVQSSVLFENTINYMADCKVDTIIEIGPGKTLAGFVKKTAKDIKVYSIETPKDIDNIIAAIKEI